MSDQEPSNPGWAPPGPMPPPAPPAPTALVTRPAKKSYRGLWIALGIVAVVAVLAIAGSKSRSDEPSAAELNYLAHAVCAQWVRDSLKAPATADFPEYTDQGVTIAEDGSTYTVLSFVDAENGFGAMIRTSFICVTERRANGNFTLLNLSLDD